MDYIGDLIFSVFGNLLRPIGIYSIPYALQIMLLSLAVGDFITGFLRLINFSYWRYFSASRYLLVLAAFLIHRTLRVNLENQPLLTTILFYVCLSHCCLYLVDLAWTTTQLYYNPKIRQVQGLLIAIAIFLALLLISKTNDGDSLYPLYLLVILIASLVISAAKMFTGLLIIIISLVQKYCSLYSSYNFYLCVVLEVIMLLLILDRQGKEAKINFLNATADWPASSYFIMASIKVYLYFRIIGGNYSVEYVIGAIFLQTAIVASIR